MEAAYLYEYVLKNMSAVSHVYVRKAPVFTAYPQVIVRKFILNLRIKLTYKPVASEAIVGLWNK